MNGCRRLHFVLYLLFISMIVHSYKPDKSLMFIILYCSVNFKDYKVSLPSIDNYRAIPPFICICSLFENALLILHKPQLLSSEM